MGVSSYVIPNIIKRLVENADTFIDGLAIGDANTDQAVAHSRAVRHTLIKMNETRTPVLLDTDSRLMMISAMIAALSGGPPLLIPYAHTASALRETLQHVKFSRALTDRKSSLPEGVQSIELIQPDQPDFLLQADYLHPDAPWVYLFTGGSTGTPKIWSKSPRNLLTEASFLSKTFGIDNYSRILSTVPSNHIYGMLYTLLLPILSGAKIIIKTPSYPKEIAKALAETRATVLVSIPAHYKGLKEIKITRHCLNTAFSSGSAFPAQDDIALYRATNISVTEIYGSTETGGIAYRCRSKNQHLLKPFACVHTREDSGYLSVQSDFLSHELKTNSDGFFKTADRVQFRDSGEFELLGRCDGIIKVGGKRVDLAKIREVTLQIDGVADAYAMSIPVERSRGNEIFLSVQGSVEVKTVMSFIRNKLPHYAIPRKIVIVDRIPLSPTGKYMRDEIIKLFTNTKSISGA